MPTVYQQAIDIQWVVILGSSATVYAGKQAALNAAVALSAANANAKVQMAQLQEVVYADGTGVGPHVELPGGAIPQWIVQLASGTTYYPLETARTTAYSTSSSNSNAGVYVAKVAEVVTAP